MYPLLVKVSGPPFVGAVVTAPAITASTRSSPVLQAGAVPAPPASGPRLVRSVERELQLVEYSTSVVFSVRSAETADASLAAILERSKFGIAMAAMIKMIATTISNSIREKPFCLLLRIRGAPFRFRINQLRCCDYN